MANDDSKTIQKPFSYKKKFKSHSYVKDNDLQIHISMIKDANVYHRVPHFKLFRSPAYRQADLTFVDTSQSLLSQSDSLKMAMDEAQNSFNSMMLIREQLNIAYLDLMQKQS